ncbi:MAG: peptidylprolyl isomerase [Rhodocyclaceae bacterium]|nr:peptidylprolyl isomerase [Rhodocyclaceae bacterium]
MPVIVNGHELTDAEVERELDHHQDAANPMRRATTAVVLRRVMLDEAARLGIADADEETLIDALLEKAVPLAAPGEDECERHYRQHPQRFTVGELVEASHILYQVTSRVDLDALRRRAEKTLAELLEYPERFAERARTQSNCPSGEVGGNLGQLGRGDTAPEFEKIVFSMPAGSIFPRLVESRFGLHIVRVERRIEGRLLPYAQVAPQIAAALGETRRATAWRQYLQLLVGQARIEGIALEGADSPLVQ